MKYIIQTCAFITSLSILIITHELGHFILAKILKIKVEKLILFFDPYFYIFKKKIGETIYGIGWIPLGGYIKIHSKTNIKTYKYIYKKIIIMCGGSIMNIILSFIIFTLLSIFYKIQYPYYDNNITNHENYLKIKNKLHNFDIHHNIINKITLHHHFTITYDIINMKIYKIVTQKTVLDELIYEHNHIKKQCITKDLININSIHTNISNVKNDQIYTYSIKNLNNLYKYLCIILHNKYIKKSIWNHLKTGYLHTGKSLLIQLFFIEEIINLHYTSYKKLNSIIGMINIFPPNWNWYIFWYLTANMSIWLSLFNLTPIPSLDGGNILFNIIHLIMNKPLNSVLKQVLYTVGYMFTIIITSIILIKDVINFFY